MSLPGQKLNFYTHRRNYFFVIWHVCWHGFLYGNRFHLPYNQFSIWFPARQQKCNCIEKTDMRFRGIGYAFSSQRRCDFLRSHLPSRANAPAMQIGYSHWENWKYSIKMSEPFISENLFVHFRKTLCPISKRPFSSSWKMTFCYRIGAVAYTLLHASVTDTLPTQGVGRYLQYNQRYTPNHRHLSLKWGNTFFYTNDRFLLSTEFKQNLNR